MLCRVEEVRDHHGWSCHIAGPGSDPGSITERVGAGEDECYRRSDVEFVVGDVLSYQEAVFDVVLSHKELIAVVALVVLIRGHHKAAWNRSAFLDPAPFEVSNLVLLKKRLPALSMALFHSLPPVLFYLSGIINLPALEESRRVVFIVSQVSFVNAGVFKQLNLLGLQLLEDRFRRSFVFKVVFQEEDVDLSLRNLPQLSDLSS